MHGTQAAVISDRQNALKRIEKLVQVVRPENFEFPPPIAKDIVQCLEAAAAPGGIVTVTLNGIDYGSTYLSTIEKFLKRHPIMVPFDSTLTSSDLIQMAQKVVWLLLFGVLRKRLITPELSSARSEIYDGLARTFSELRRKLATMVSRISDRFVELWSSAICAAMFTMMMRLYEDTDLYRNCPFVVRLENDIRDLLVGFSSPYVQDYHQSIMMLIPKDLRMAFPVRVTVGGDDEETDITNVLKHEPEIQRAWQQRKNTLFKTSTQTALMQHAMKLTGARNPVEVKTHVVQRGNAEKSHLKVSKAEEVVKQTKVVMKDYGVSRQRFLDELYDEEVHYERTSAVPRIVPLGVSFENFGVSRKPRPPKVQTARVIVPAPVKRRMRPYRRKREFDEAQMMRDIDDAHAYILEHP